MSHAAMGGDWIEEKIAQRHQSARLRVMREMHGRHKAQREKRRVIVGMVVVEMARKAYTFSVTHSEYSRYAKG